MNILLAEITKLDGKNAGNKARADVQSILEGLGFKHIHLYKKGYGKIKIILSTILALIKTFFIVTKGNCLVVEHPYTYSYERMLSNFSKFLRKNKHCKTVLLIHDINSIRFGKIPVKKEILLFNNYSHIICHNEVMKKFLIENGCKSKIVVLGLFDYLIEDKKRNNFLCNKNEIAIAGNLSKTKCGYLYEVPENIDIKINLYGIGVKEKDLPPCMQYKGAYTPEDLPDALIGRFGLIWDGTSLECGKDIVGNYLRYNNPHKASLYIASGIPVIVWNDSAIASYVVNNKLGIAVNNLLEIPMALNNITEEQYAVFIKSINDEKKKLINGEHLKYSINRILSD